MKLDNFELVAVPNPHQERVNAEGLEHKINTCVAAGESPDFYVGVQQRMAAFQSNLDATADAGPASSTPSFTPKAPGR